MEMEEVLEVEEATLGKVARRISMTPVEVGEESYNAGKNQQNECCYNTAGHGQVTITLM